MTVGAALHDGLRHWAAAAPDAVALEDESSTLTFADVLDRVDRIGPAARRATAGWADDRFLPVLVDRSVDSCVAVLACLAHRVPFFPVDARTAAGRMDQLLDLTGRPDRFLSGPPADGVRWPEDCLPVDITADAPSPTSLGAVDEHRPGLVVFTSGTTGRPKGVVLDHATLDARFRRWHDEPHDDPPDFKGVLVLPVDSTFGLAMLGQVASGCSILVVDASTISPLDLLRRLTQFAPTEFALPPQLGRILAQLPDKDGLFLSSVERIQTGSEGFRFESLAGLLSILPESVEVLFGYGATEVFHLLSYRFTLGDAPAEGQVPLGLPAYRDEVRFVPVPDMGDGIFEVQGTGAIAMGYLGDDEQTEARFIHDDDGRRWWSSQDLVRLNDDGLYEHVGRADDVVKVQGRLVSPSDVQAALQRIPGIRAALVVPHELDSAVRLIAHVEVQPGIDVTLAQVRSALDEQLPAHMVPSAVMRHASLPLTDRGKVDRDALMSGPFEAWA